MYSEVYFKTLIIILTKSSNFKSFPFKFYPISGSFHSCSNHRILFLLNVLLDFCYRSVTTCISIHMMVTNSSEISKLVLLVVYLAGSVSFAGSITVSLFQYEYDTLVFSNMVLKMDSDMGMFMP